MQENKQILKNTLAKQIKILRKKSKKSISLLSDEVNLSKSIWSDLEKGVKDPQFSTLWRISESLNIPLSKIIAAIEKELKNSISFIED
ncbi:MAG: helix-turn-helix transcriptional regulator [Candidatus Gastranaerophilales bacterium]|nr:helix-turn-helix transcriptional regulator [Candidatus Gastranaerophilales bacterium]